MQIASQMDAQGMPPPKGLMSMLGGQPATSNAEIPSGAAPQPDMNLGGLMPGAEADGNPMPGGKSGSLMPALTGGAMKLAAPTPMPGPVPGVSGGVKAPQEAPINPAVMSSLVQLLMQKHQGQTGPSLGQLIR